MNDELRENLKKFQELYIGRKPERATSIYEITKHDGSVVNVEAESIGQSQVHFIFFRGSQPFMFIHMMEVLEIRNLSEPLILELPS